MYVRYNQNPCKKRTIDCTVRALATLLDEDWNKIYVQLCVLGYEMCDMPSSKAVINEYLDQQGYSRRLVYGKNYTVRDFAEDHPRGRFLLATDSHGVLVISGYTIDTWNSLDEIILLYWEER